MRGVEELPQIQSGQSVFLFCFVLPLILTVCILEGIISFTKTRVLILTATMADNINFYFPLTSVERIL